MTKREYILKELKKYEVDIFEVIKDILKKDIVETYLPKQDYKAVSKCCDFINMEYNQQLIDDLSQGNIELEDILEITIDSWLTVDYDDVDEIYYSEVIIAGDTYYAITSNQNDLNSNYYFIYYEDVKDLYSYIEQEILAKATPRQVITYEY